MASHRASSLIPALALLALGACERAEAYRAVPEIRAERLPNGAVRVRNLPPSAGAAGYEWRWTEELRIGTRDGEGPDAFGQIKGLAVDTAGRMFVLDAFAQQIRIFDPDGTHYGTVGGPGEGPGEFENAHGVALAPDQTLTVPDPANQRFTRFDRDGRLLATLPTSFSGYRYTWEGGYDVEGRLYDAVPGAPTTSSRVAPFSSPSTGRSGGSSTPPVSSGWRAPTSTAS